MADKIQALSTHVQQRFDGKLLDCTTANGELTIQVSTVHLSEVCVALRDDSETAFEMLIDLCGVDYLDYDNGEVERQGSRFAVVYHLLSIANNQRIRIKCFLENEDELIIDSVVDIWAVANWFEREAFDLFGILFEGHPDLRRLLTDYGFIGHPFRKDFPLIGNVEMRYDPERRRVIYEPVTIEPRITVPRVIREDHRYMDGAKNDKANVEVKRG